MSVTRSAALALAVALYAPHNAAAQTQSVRIQVIDVGQADGILVRTPNTQWVLIDGAQGRLLAQTLQANFGVDRLALAVGSHRHRDHIGGIDNVMDVVPTDRYFGDTTEYSSAVDDSLRAVIERNNIPVQLPGADTIVIDGIRFIFLPPDPVDDANENDNSVVVRLEHGQFSMLFAGDAEDNERDWLVANHPALLDVDVLKASHHGSRNGTSPGWLNAVTPDRVVISVGLHRGFRHPHPEAVTAYEAAVADEERVYCTNRHGTITIYGFPDGRIRIHRQRISNQSCVFDGT